MNAIDLKNIGIRYLARYAHAKNGFAWFSSDADAKDFFEKILNEDRDETVHYEIVNVATGKIEHTTETKEN